MKIEDKNHPILAWLFNQWLYYDDEVKLFCVRPRAWEFVKALYAFLLVEILTGGFR